MAAADSEDELAADSGAAAATSACIAGVANSHCPSRSGVTVVAGETAAVLLLALNLVVFLNEIFSPFFATSCCASALKDEYKDKNQMSGIIIEVFQVEAKAYTRRGSSAQDISYISIRTPPNRITRVKPQPNNGQSTYLVQQAVET